MLPVIHKISTYEKDNFIRNGFLFINRMQFERRKTRYKR